MSKMVITDEQFSHVAKLARLQLTSAEKKIYQNQLLPVLAHIANLNRLDTESVAPTFQVTSLNSIFQTSIPNSLSQSEALSAASKTTTDYFIVPQTIDK